MRRWCDVVLTVVTASVVAAACAASDLDDIDAAGTDPAGPGDAAGLLVTIEDPSEPALVLVDSSERTVGAVDLSPACRSACAPRRVFATAGAARWYASTDAGVVAVDRATGSVELVAPGTNVVVDPDGQRHLVVDDPAGTIGVIDTESGAVQSTDAITSPAVRVFEAGSAVVVTSARAEAMIVDPDRARVTRLEDDVVVGLQPVDPTGTRILAVAGRQRDRQLITIEVDEPEARVLIGPAPSTSFITGWLGDDVIVVEPTEGKVSVVEQDRPVELPPIAPGQSGSARLHTDPSGPHALLQVDQGADSRWYRIDADERTVTPLPDLDGLTTAHQQVGRDLIVVSDHDDGPRVSRMLVVPVHPGGATELVTSPVPAAYDTARVGPGRLYLRELSPDGGAWLIDIDDGTQAPTVAGANPVVSPDGTTVTVSVRDGRDARVVNVPADGGPTGPPLDGWAVGWIPG